MSHKLKPNDLQPQSNTAKNPFNTALSAKDTTLDIDIDRFNVDQQLAHSRIFPRSK